MILTFISSLISLLIFFLIIAAILTWIPDSPGTSLSSAKSFCSRVTAPIYAPVRRVIPPIQGGFDISPIVVILALGVLRSIL